MIDIAMAIALVLQVQQDCETSGTSTHCQSQAPSDPASAMLNSTLRQNEAQANGAASVQVEQVRQHSTAATQIGSLIEKSDCAGAARLASYYGYADLKKGVERACGK